MNVLFLDIDGVCNSLRTQAAFNGYPYSFEAADMARFDPVALALLRRLCQETGSSVVLSSDWRYDDNCTAHAAANAFDLPIMDVTPMNVTGDRAMEISAWLAGHPEVTVYAVVDDMRDLFNLHGERWVLTDPAYGLSLANYSALRLLLLGATTLAKPANFETYAAGLQRLRQRSVALVTLEDWDAMPEADRALLELAKAAGGGRWSADDGIVWFDDGDAAMQVMNPIPVFLTHANLGHWPEAIYEGDVAAFAAAACPAAIIALLARIAELERQR